MSTTGQPLNFESSSPAAPSGTVNVVFQADAPTTPPTAVVRDVSAYMPVMTSTVGGAVPTPPNDNTKFLNGIGTFTTPSGGGGGSNDDISYYLSPATIVNPSLSSWAYHVNATHAANANGALVMTTYSSSFLEILGESVPAEDFDLIGCFAMNPSFVSGKLMALALVLWDSGSGKVVTFQVNVAQGTANPTISVQHNASFTGSSTTAFTIQTPTFGTSPVWLRINCSYSKYTFYLSVDGQSWDQVYQESTTAYMTSAANNCGIGFFNNSTTKANLVVPHFELSSYVGS